MYIQFYPTLRCNRSCDFCFNKGLPSVPDMPLKKFRKMLNVLSAAGVSTIDIMGGEPTLHPGIETIIADAEQAGFRVNISSNGTDLPVLERIMRNSMRTTVGISVNDRDQLKTVKGFIERHHPIVKTVFRKGMDLSLVEEILTSQPERMYLLYQDMMEEAGPGQTQSFDLFLAVVKERFGSDRVGTVFCSGFLPDTGTCPELAQVRCPAGTTKLGIFPDGAVYPCNLFFGKKELLLGNILVDPFDRIWSHLQLSFFRTFSGNCCSRRDCTLHAACHGGCPAHSLVHTGDLSASEPRCAKA